jgi:hypothetical protein
VAHHVEVHAPGKAPAKFELSDAYHWIGAGAHGQLRPSGDSSELQPEIEFFPQADGVQVIASPKTRVRVSFEGVEIKQALVRWGEEIFLDETRLAFYEVKSSGPRTALLIAFAATAVALAMMTFWSGDGEASDSRLPEVPAPPLYEGQVTCSMTAANAEARAVEAERLATAKRERYAFDSRDGVSALPLFQEAVACLRDAGRIQDAQRVNADFVSFRQKLDEDYAALGLELRTARSAKRYAEALRATRELEAFVAARPSDAYSEWLLSLHREFEQKLAKR